MQMNAKRRNKLRKLAEELPVPQFTATRRPRAARRLGLDQRPDRGSGETGRAARRSQSARCISSISIRCRTASKKSSRIQRIVVVELNDEGLYGYGQLAAILRARYCDPDQASPRPTGSPSA